MMQAAKNNPPPVKNDENIPESFIYVQTKPKETKMKFKKTLVGILGSAAILMTANSASSQNITDYMNMSKPLEVPKVTGKVLSPKDDFKIDYGTKAKVQIVFPFNIGDGTARWESRSCEHIPGESGKKDHLKVLDGTINMEIQFYGRLDLHFKTYMNNKGDPIKDFIADYHYEGRGKQKFTSLDSALMKEAFPDTWKDIREFHHSDFRGKKDVTNFETSYFTILDIIKNSQSQGLMPVDTVLDVFEDTTSYKVETTIEKKDDRYIARLYVKGKDGKQPPDIHALKSVTINIGEDYVPRSIKVRFKKWGIIPAEADIKMKDYEIK